MWYLILDRPGTPVYVEIALLSESTCNKGRFMLQTYAGSDQATRCFIGEKPPENGHLVSIEPITEDPLLPPFQGPQDSVFAARSTVYLTRLEQWQRDDLTHENNRFKLIDSCDISGENLKMFFDELNAPRKTDLTYTERFRDLFAIIPETSDFLTIEDGTSQATENELECYNLICRHILQFIAKMKLQDPPFSSSELASFFFSMMIIFPFLIDGPLVPVGNRIELTSAIDCHIQMLLQTSGSDKPCTYTPHSDFALLYVHKNTPILPTFICEVDSGNEGQDKARALFQGAVLSRQWRYILSKTRQDSPLVLGLYLARAFTVRLYIFHADSRGEVTCVEKSFALNEQEDALRLAKVLFNYRDIIAKVLTGDGAIDTQAFKRLKDPNALTGHNTRASELKKRSKDKAKAGERSNDGGRPGKKQNVRDAVDNIHPVFLSEPVKSFALARSALIEPTDHEHVAVLKTMDEVPKKLGYLKITNRAELDALKLIRTAGSEELKKCALLPIASFVVDGRDLVFLPNGGERISRARETQGGITGREISVAREILEVFSLLHDLYIAHLDIKPLNILWDLDAQIVHPIDYNSSIILGPGRKGKIVGDFGTEGYSAPEVEMGDNHEYDPFLADAYSCGVVLDDLLEPAEHSEEKILAQEIARALKRESTGERWTIRKALKEWEDRRKKCKCVQEYPMQNGPLVREQHHYPSWEGLSSFPVASLPVR